MTRAKVARRAKAPATSRAKRAAPSASHFAHDAALREQIVKFLDGGEAHVNLRHALAGLPEAPRGVKPPGAPHTAWQLLEHLRIAQSDILEFSRDPRHVSPQWPEGYWPVSEAPPAADAWDKSVNAVERDLAAMKTLVRNPKTDLFARIPHGAGQTILREALLVADHNSYHLGQIVLLRRLLGVWVSS